MENQPPASSPLSPRALGFLFGDLGFSLDALSTLTGKSKAELHTLLRTQSAQRFRGPMYWRLSPALTRTLADRLGLELSNRDWHIHEVHRVLREGVLAAQRAGRLDGSRLDALVDELPTLLEAEGLSAKEAERVQKSRSFGGSLPWLTEQRIARGLRPRLGGQTRARAGRP